MTGERPPTPRTFALRLPTTVWALGFVSLLMDVSSEMIHSLLPIFLVTTLSASATSLGLIEGVAEAAALVTKLFSGALSDRLGKRKALAVAGYGIAAAAKPLFALAGGVGAVFAARLIDRVAKGVRGAPRDALIADVTPRDLRGAAYGLRQSLDTVGAFTGPLLATALMLATDNDVRRVFWLAVVPAALSVAVLWLGVREPSRKSEIAATRPVAVRELADLGRGYWIVLGLGALFTLARFSEAFLLVRALDVGLSPAMVPLILVLMSAVYAVTAYPAGRLSDRVGRSAPLTAGLAVLVASDLLLAVASSVAQVAIGAALWGLHMGLTQSLLAAIVADTAPAARRGTAFGIFGLATAVATLAASVLAGTLWDRLGAPATFLAGAVLASLALAGFVELRRRGIHRF